MRKIKFRAWHFGRKKMYKDVAFKNKKGFELMQFTGLIDRYGQEIYEGDILRCSNKILTIHFRETAFYLSEDLHGTHVAYHLFTNWNLTSMLEVIGNIYENSDLIK